MSDQDKLVSMFTKAFPKAHTLQSIEASETVITKKVNGKRVSEVVDSADARLELLIHGMDTSGFSFKFDSDGNLIYIQAFQNY